MAKKDTDDGWLKRAIAAVPWWPVAQVTACLLLLAGVVAGARYGWLVLRQSGEFSVEQEGVYLTEKPDCVRREAMMQELREELSVVLEDATIFDSDLCDRVAHELRASPWVTRVKEITRVLPNQLRCRLTFRRPAAKVETEEHYHMIDRDGYWLPVEFYREPTTWKEVDLPGIKNSNLSNAPPRGRQWDDASLPVGARLTEYLLHKGVFRTLPVTRIDVTRVGRGSNEAEVVLFTDEGPEIRWGTTDAYEEIAGLDRPGNAPEDQEKLSMLGDMLADHPGLEGLEYVDLRFSKLYYKRPEGGRESVSE
ncbi:MAG: cell division protein FtsQ/DivIB [Planctomycetota bacterium]